MATMRVPDPEEPPSETHGSEAPELRCALKTRCASWVVGRGGEGEGIATEGKDSWGLRCDGFMDINFAPIFSDQKKSM